MEQNHLYQIGQNVKFERNSLINSNSIQILAKINRILETDKNIYIIEHEKGWNPNSLRASQFSLDINKKYLFVFEDELSEI